jgi:hypothetical protein
VPLRARRPSSRDAGVDAWYRYRTGSDLYKGVLGMAYILSGCISDGQAIHHSDSRQVLNLDGGL